MDRVLSLCGGNRWRHKNKYHVEASSWSSGRTELQVLKTKNNIRVNTIATHALIYACWAGDRKLAGLILMDMRELIDIDMQLGGKGILELTAEITELIGKGYRLDNAVNICRLLVIHYGSKLITNYHSLLSCCVTCGYGTAVVHGYGSVVVHGYPDVLAYLVLTQAENLVTCWRDDNIFECLIKEGEYEAAVLYLTHHNNRISDCDVYVFRPAMLLLSAELFVSVLDAFKPEPIVSYANGIIRALCSMDNVPERKLKVAAALDRWSTICDSTLIKFCLADCWDKNRNGLHESKEDPFESVTRLSVSSALQSTGSFISPDYLVGQMIVEKFIDAISDQWLSIAMVVCVDSPNLELLGRVIVKSLDMIQKKPKHLEHVLLECCAQRNIDASMFVLRLTNTEMHTKVFEFWCEAADLEAVSVMFEVYGRELIDVIPQAFIRACKWGDTELVQLLSQFAGDSIHESDYQKALKIVCHWDLPDIILMLLELYPPLQLNVKKLNLDAIRPETINLLNTVFGTSINPEEGGEPVPVYKPCSRYVKYGSWGMYYKMHYDRSK